MAFCLKIQKICQRSVCASTLDPQDSLLPVLSIIALNHLRSGCRDVKSAVTSIVRQNDWAKEQIYSTYNLDELKIHGCFQHSADCTVLSRSFHDSTTGMQSVTGSPNLLLLFAETSISSWAVRIVVRPSTSKAMPHIRTYG